MTVSLTTELDAVNAILGAVGESPVAELEADTGSFVDAELARNLLTQEMRRIQTIGWTFNTELEVVLTRDNNDEIAVPAETLRFLSTDTNFVVRGTRVYDRSLKTYEHTADLTVNLVLLLPFEETPEPMRYYAMVCAARKFQDQIQGDPALHKFSQRDEYIAKAALDNYEAEVSRANMFDSSALLLRIKSRR